MNARTPPREALDEVGAALTAAGIEWALGGSGLLAAHGLAGEVHDWDVTTDALLEDVRAALGGFRWSLHGASGVHADHKLTREDGAIEVIVGFALRVGNAIVRIPTLIEDEHDGIPLGSLACWAVAYALMGREGRSERVFAQLGRAGAPPASVARLLEEPLPPPLAARVRALPPAR